MATEQDGIEIHSVKCAKCDVHLEGKDHEPTPELVFTCPKCGVSDTHENIINEVVKYIEYTMLRATDDMFKRALSNVKGISYKSGRSPKKNFRFKIDISLKL